MSTSVDGGGVKAVGLTEVGRSAAAVGGGSDVGRVRGGVGDVGVGGCGGGGHILQSKSYSIKHQHCEISYQNIQ
jgi:hypothetical protein